MGKEKLVATGKANELSEEKNKLERKFQNSRSMLEKSKKENKTLTTRAESAEKEVASLRRELQDSLKQVKKASASSGSRDVRLNRAAEENDRLKEKVKDLEGQLQDAPAAVRRNAFRCRSVLSNECRCCGRHWRARRRAPGRRTSRSHRVPASHADRRSAS